MSSTRFRREIIRAGVVGLIAFSGCIERTQSGIQLGGVRVENFTSERQTIGVTVEKDGQTVHDSTVDVAGVSETADGENVFGAEFVDCTWDAADTGDVVVSAHRERDDETARLGINEDLSQDCYWASIRVDRAVTAVWNDCEPYEGSGNLCYE